MTNIWGVTSPGSLQDSLDLRAKVASKLSNTRFGRSCFLRAWYWDRPLCRQPALLGALWPLCDAGGWSWPPTRRVWPKSGSQHQALQPTSSPREKRDCLNLPATSWSFLKSSVAQQGWFKLHGLVPTETWLHRLCEGNQGPVTAIKALISCCAIVQAGCSTAQSGGFWFSSTILFKVAVDRTDAEPHRQGRDMVGTRCWLKMAQGRQTRWLRLQRLGGERAAGCGDKVAPQ